MSLQNVNLTAGSGIPAVGTTLSVGNNGSPLIYNLIGNQAKISTSYKTDSADTTNQGSQWDQSIPTLLVATWNAFALIIVVLARLLLSLELFLRVANFGSMQAQLSPVLTYWYQI